MRIEVEDLYAVSGFDEAQGLTYLIREAQNVHMANLQANPPVSYIDPTKFSGRDEVTAAAELVQAAWRDGMDALRKKINKAELAVQAKAAELAKVPIQDAADEILRETVRYDIKDSNGAAGSSLLKSDTPSSQIILSTAGITPLISALRRIEKRRSALESASSVLTSKIEKLKEQLLSTQFEIKVSHLP